MSLWENSPPHPRTRRDYWSVIFQDELFGARDGIRNCCTVFLLDGGSALGKKNRDKIWFKIKSSTSYVLTPCSCPKLGHLLVKLKSFATILNTLSAIELFQSRKFYMYVRWFQLRNFCEKKEKFCEKKDFFFVKSHNCLKTALRTAWKEPESCLETACSS